MSYAPPRCGSAKHCVIVALYHGVDRFIDGRRIYCFLRYAFMTNSRYWWSLLWLCPRVPREVRGMYMSISLILCTCSMIVVSCRFCDRHAIAMRSPPPGMISDLRGPSSVITSRRLRGPIPLASHGPACSCGWAILPGRPIQAASNFTPACEPAHVRTRPWAVASSALGLLFYTATPPPSAVGLVRLVLWH